MCYGRTSGHFMWRLAAEPSRTAGLLFPSQCQNDLANHIFDGVGLEGFKGRTNVFYWPKLFHPYKIFYYSSPSHLSFYILVLWGWGLQTDGVYITLSQRCTADLL